MRAVLRRARATRAQAGLTPGSGAATSPARSRSRAVAARRAAAAVANRILVLVDDVMTTGATLDACARVLKRAGAREVRTLTLARALPHAAAGRSARRSHA